MKHSIQGYGGAVAVLMLAAGCAGNQTQPDQTSLSRAEASIEQAERAGAQRYASRELNVARDALDEARDAQEREEYDVAARLATQAELDAQLAAAIAGNREAQTAAEELDRGLDTLRDETRRGERP